MATTERVLKELENVAPLMPVAERRKVAKSAGWKAYGILAALRAEAKRAARGDSVMLSLYDQSITELAQCIGGCIRVKGSPVPKSYKIYLEITLALFIATLPFLIASVHGYASIITVAINVLVLRGVVRLADGMEEPFGTDFDDLPLGFFSNVVEKQVNGLDELASEAGY